LLSRCALDRNELGADEMREDDEGLDADAVLGGWRETGRSRKGVRGKMR
jgi:hypothetical protein